MCLTAFALGGAALGAFGQSRAANRATDAAQDASQQQLALQREIYGDQTARFDPFMQFGQSGIAELQNALGAAPTYQQYNHQQDPGFQYLMDQSQNAIQGSAAGQGGLFSGATLRALQQNATGLASQDYNQGFARHQQIYGNQQNEYQNRLNALFNQVNMGQSAAGMQATAGSNFAAGATNALGNYGDAGAAGAIAQGNALTGGINNALGGLAYMQTQPFTSSWV
jgi:hypothetical protein